MVEVRGLIKERGWVPEPCLGLAGPGHQSPAKNKGEATGWSKEAGHLPSASRWQ